MIKIIPDTFAVTLLFVGLTLLITAIINRTINIGAVTIPLGNQGAGLSVRIALGCIGMVTLAFSFYNLFGRDSSHVIPGSGSGPISAFGENLKFSVVHDSSGIKSILVHNEGPHTVYVKLIPSVQCSPNPRWVVAANPPGTNHNDYYCGTGSTEDALGSSLG